MPNLDNEIDDIFQRWYLSEEQQENRCECGRLISAGLSSCLFCASSEE